MLVPEAVLLMTLLCLHAALGASPLLALLGVGLVCWFMLRMGLLYAARRALERAEYERAARLAWLALACYPLSADAHALLGGLHQANGRFSAAAVSLGRAVRYYPLEAGLRAALSAALLDDGRPREALDEAGAATMLDPTCAVAYLYQANAEEQLGAPAELVERHLRGGLDQPAAPADEAALRCALAALLLRQGRAAEARLMLAGAERLLACSSAAQRAGLHYCIGDLLRQIGDSEAARSHFSASETLDPKGRFAAAAWRAARL
jgi:tetratricopeptide (TPR) repeat protein